MRRGVAGIVAVLAAAHGGAIAQAPSSPEARFVVERVVGGAESARKGVLWWLTGKAPDEPFVRPYGVAWDGEDLLVTDPGAARLVRVSPGGKTTASREALFASPIGVAVCRSGIVVTDSRVGSVTLLDSKLLRVRHLAERLDRPTGVACNGDRIFVVETGRHQIVVMDASGQVERKVGRRGSEEGSLNFPTALALAGRILWVGDTLNFRVQGLRTSDGTFDRSFGIQGDAPGETPQVKGIAVDPSGRLWVSDSVLDSVAVFREDGTFLAHVGGPGHGPGEFSFPAGVASHRDGRVAVVDSLNRRIQVLRLDAPDEGRR